jgi:Na+-transporting methylmalonyl-CoA/oxaloacetate decarboxylase gamma subunit
MNEMLLSLEITALGMGLVFSVILLLWWMMTLLTRLTSEMKPAPNSTTPAPGNDRNHKQQAAALAVVLALAEQELIAAHPLPEPPTAIISAWQLGMRTRQMSEKWHLRRHTKE